MPRNRKKRISRHLRMNPPPMEAPPEEGPGPGPGPEINLIHFSEQSFTEKWLSSLEDLPEHSDEGQTAWIDITGLNDNALLRETAERFGIHPLVLEDICNTGQRAKSEDYGDYQYTVLKMVSWDEDSMQVEVEQVSMTVFQPRLANVGTFTMAASELLEWADSFLKPRAELAFKGEGDFCSGPHCRFCKVRATCRKRAEANLDLARYDFAKPVLLGDHEIAEILTQADELASWVSDIRGYAFSLLERGGTLEGFKLVEGRSIRRYADEAAAADAVRAAGFDPYEHKVLGITAMTALLGRTRFNEILGSHVCKPKGKPTLVPVGDKRPAITINDFMEEK